MLAELSGGLLERPEVRGLQARGLWSEEGSCLVTCRMFLRTLKLMAPYRLLAVPAGPDVPLDDPPSLLSSPDSPAPLLPRPVPSTKCSALSESCVVSSRGASVFPKSGSESLRMRSILLFSGSLFSVAGKVVSKGGKEEGVLWL